jgi:UDP-glucose 4-epimerase
MVYALVDAGEEVVVIDNLSTGHWWALAPQARLVEGDVGDETLIARLAREHKFDAIIHFAGSIVVPESVTDPLAYYLNNTVKTRSLIAAAVKAQIPRFVFSSTAAVYGNPKSAPVSEDAEPSPISPYGASKLMSEWMLRDSHAAYGIQYAALRYFNVAGADPQKRTGQSTPQATHLIKVACQTALGERPHMDVFGTDYDTPDGTCVRDYIHVSDLAQAHLDALTYLRKDGKSGVFNCGYGRGLSVLEIVKAVERAAGRPIDKRMAPRRAGDPAVIVAGADKIRREFGWTPKHDDIDGIVASALAWEDYLRHRNRAA